MAKGDNKPRGRMSAYAYFVQTCREEHKKKHPNESVVFKDFTKKCADRWGTMSDKEKARFHDMAKKDKARYEAEMKNYVPPPGASKRRGKAKKDPNAPKRALSAFFMFSQDQRSKVRAAHPEWGVGDVARELGQQWAKMTSAAKVPYEKQAEKDKLRYEKEMANFRKGGGGAKPAKAPKVAPPEDDDDEEEEDEEEEDDEEDDE